MVRCQIPRRGLAEWVQMSGLLSDTIESTRERPGYKDPDEWSVVTHQGEAWFSDSTKILVSSYVAFLLCT